MALGRFVNKLPTDAGLIVVIWIGAGRTHGVFSRPARRLEQIVDRGHRRIVEIGAAGPDAHQGGCNILVRQRHSAAQESLLLLGVHIKYSRDPQRIGAELILVHERVGEAHEVVGFRSGLFEVTVATRTGLHEDRVPRVGLLFTDVADERIPRRGERFEILGNAMREHLTGIGVIGAEVVAADRHRIGHIGDVAGKAAVDIESLTLCASSLVFVIGPGQGLEERNQRHLPLDLLGVAATVVGHEKLVVAEQARLEPVGPDHGHKDSEEVGGVNEESGEVFCKQEARARSTARRDVLMESLEVEKRVWNALRKTRLGITGIGTRKKHR